MIATPFPQRFRIPVVCFALCAALNVWFSLIGWRHNLLEGHEFRQTQTALTAECMRSAEWHSVADPLPLFGPPWSAPMEFPLYQYVVAHIANLGGWPTEQTGRAVAMFALYAMLPALFALLGRLSVPRSRRWLCLGLVLVTPIYWYYSRVVMIESTALCCAVWFLWAFCHAVERRSVRWAVLAAGLGVIAGLAKATTLAVFLTPALWFTLTQLSARRKSEGAATRFTARTALTAGAIVLVVLAGTQAWVAYGDHVKSANPLSAFLTSHQMVSWNYGPLALRFEARYWQSIGRILHESIAPAWALIAAITVGVVSGPGSRWKVAGLTACYLAAALVFANLYFVHDYYHYAAGLFVLSAVIVAGSEFVDRAPDASWRKWLAGTAFVGLLVSQVTAYRHSYFAFQSRPDLAPPELVRVLQAATNPDDVVLLYGYDWNPVIPYMAHRRAVMVGRPYLHDYAAQESAFRPVAAQIGAVALHADSSKDTELLAELQRRLDLSPVPVAAEAETVVFVRSGSAARARQNLVRASLQSFHVDAASPAESVPAWKPLAIADIQDPSALDLISPRPVELRTQFGIGTALADETPVLLAHAPSEIVVPVAGTARTVSLGFGILPSAYSDGHASDGVEFRVEMENADGTQRTLFRRLLMPVTHPEDRGTQSAEVTLPASPAGRLRLRTLPGPANNTAYDWAYWARVVVK